MAGFDIEGMSAAPLFLPGVVLTLKQKTPLCCRDELLWTSEMIAIVRFASSGKSDVCCMMEVIIPQRVQPKTALLRRTEEPSILRLVLSDDNRTALPSRLTHALSDGRDNMF